MGECNTKVSACTMYSSNDLYSAHVFNLKKTIIFSSGTEVNIFTSDSFVFAQDDKNRSIKRHTFVKFMSHID